MQEINPDNLFSIFEAGDEEVYKENNVDYLLKNPYVLIGMVVRGMDNYKLMDIIYTRNYPKIYKLHRPKVKLKYYSNLYSYLTRIDINSITNEFTIGEDYEVDATRDRLNEMLYFFEKLEHYEKCAGIKKVLDKLL